jgi:hypothetical protein
MSGGYCVTLKSEIQTALLSRGGQRDRVADPARGGS